MARRRNPTAKQDGNKRTIPFNVTDIGLLEHTIQKHHPIIISELKVICGGMHVCVCVYVCVPINVPASSAFFGC